MPTALLVGDRRPGSLANDALVASFVKGLPGWQVAAMATRSASGRHMFAPARRGRAIVEQALRADAVVFAGGTIFDCCRSVALPHPTATLASAAALAAMASAAGKPVAIVGVGAGTLAGRAARACTHQLVSKSRLLLLRDDESAAALAEAGTPGPFRVGTDTSWLLVEPPQSETTGGDTVLVVPPSSPVSADDHSSSTWVVEQLGAALHQLNAAGMSIEIRPFDGSRGAQPRTAARTQCTDSITRRLSSRPASSISIGPTPTNLQAAVASMRGAAVVLTYQFHGLVAAGAAGVPAVAVAEEPGLAGLAARLNQTRLSSSVGSTELARAVLARAPSDAAGPSVVKEEISKAEEEFRLLRVLLAQGQTSESDELGALPLRPVP